MDLVKPAYRRLGLDLVVRDDHGNILNPDITSAVKLFRHHDEASARLRKVINVNLTLTLQFYIQCQVPLIIVIPEF